MQWSLYYSGVTSYRDYPLSGLDPARLPQQLTAAKARTESSPHDADAWTELGEINFDLGFRSEARSSFIQALRLSPNHTQASTGLGWTHLEAGKPEEALAEFNKVQPVALMSLVGTANALYRLDRWDEADQIISKARNRFPVSPIPMQQAAFNNLIRGRPDEAMRDLDQALTLDSDNALTYSLRSNIFLVQNRKADALEAAQQAVAANPLSPSAQLSLSLVKQAEFDLDGALHAARQAVELDPNNPQAVIQESRLMFGLGQVKAAFTLAERAHQLAPDDSLVNSTWGFLQLARGHEEQATAAFEKSIAQDTTRGEPHLGLGLILFRQNKTERAVEQMRKATLLEPKVSLYQSYLGKAFYEVKEDGLADKHLAIAKQLDPRDPTPYFYNAIRLQSVNRPIEAVQDLQQSIELNDNRAVYRSRLLLDEDEAARGATLGRIYNEVGFDQLAVQEGQKSLASDPTDYSAHRLLADSYAAIPRHEIARVSELLQSQLLQPLNINPVQPQLAETDLLIPEGAGPSSLSLNEFNPLFVRDGVSLFASSVVGNNSTWGDEVMVSGIADRFSYSLGQFHYETDGFRENNDLQHDIYNVFAQFAVTPNLNAQAEFRRRETEQGDLSLDFDVDNFSQDRSTELKRDSYRLGVNLSLSPTSNILVSYLDADKKETETDTNASRIRRELSVNEEGYQAEAQYLFKSNLVNLTSGIGSYRIDRKQLESFDFSETIFGQPCPPLPTFSNDCTLPAEFPLQRDNAYFYSHLNYPDGVIWTFGVSYDDLQEGKFSRNEWNPKFGLQWDIRENMRLRLAAFQTVKPALIVEQTLETTQIAGFSQFLDDANAVKTKHYGIGLEAHWSGKYFTGVEAVHRDSEIPVFTTSNAVRSVTAFENFDERAYRSYFYWMPNSRWSFSIEPEYQEFKRPETERTQSPIRIETTLLPLSIRYADPSGFFSTIRSTYVDQLVERSATSALKAGRDRFFVLDMSLGYRLPKRFGFLSFEILNLLDEKFDFQDRNFQTSEPTNSRFIPDRLLLLRFSVDI
ncbi:MAG: TonB-dependent receptor [Candidatus Competibacteraceae bacterium]|nr:TonB-dependent receptor [Candidatus Competibacteraceae bacterium]